MLCGMRFGIRWLPDWLFARDCHSGLTQNLRVSVEDVAMACSAVGRSPARTEPALPTRTYIPLLFRLTVGRGWAKRFLASAC